jgi:hypothetical protein
MATRAGIAPPSVHKIWAAHGLKLYLRQTFKLSRDPRFIAKIEDIVGLYLNPPDKALVLAVDEKSQIHALNRTQPGRPMKKGRCRTLTHDYERNGTTTLFAALNMLDAPSSANACPTTAIASPPLSQDIDQRTPPDLDLHIIATIMPPTRLPR